MGDGKGSLGGFAGMEVSESAVSPSQAEALAELCVEVPRAFSKGEVESAAIRAGLAVARELTDRLRAGTTPGARPQSGWTAFMVRRPDGGASLVLEDTAEAQALELRLAPSGRFTGAAWRAPGDDPELLAFRVTAAGDGFALEVSDGRRVVVADLGRNRVLAFTREAGGDNVDPFAGALGGLLAEHGLTEVIPARPAPPVLDEERPAPTAARAEPSGWVLRVTSGPSPGASFQVADGAVLGRAKAAADPSRRQERLPAPRRAPPERGGVGDLGPRVVQRHLGQRDPGQVGDGPEAVGPGPGGRGGDAGRDRPRGGRPLRGADGEEPPAPEAFAGLSVGVVSPPDPDPDPDPGVFLASLPRGQGAFQSPLARPQWQPRRRVLHLLPVSRAARQNPHWVQTKTLSVSVAKRSAS